MGTQQSRPTATSGDRHQFQIAGPGATIHSDFNHTGQVDFSDAERAVRRARTGCILLPRLQEGPPSREYLTPVHIRPLDQGLQKGDELMLRFEHATDQNRVVGYKRETREKVIGLQSDRVTIKAPIISSNWSKKRFQMCATTLAGDPCTPSPASETPAPTAPAESPYDTSHPGEVWMRLQHRRSGADQSADDLALFQIAPFLLQSNLEPADRLYIVSTPETHSFVYDVMEACWKAFGENGRFQRPSHLPFPPSTTGQRAERNGQRATVDGNRRSLLSPDKMYLIDGGQYWQNLGDLPDVWVQDQMVIGYCSAPGGRAFNVVLNCKRAQNLVRFVKEGVRAEEDRTFVFNGLADSKSEQDFTDYGGNIAVSPPVTEATEPENTLAAGPPVRAHPRAPHGKIVLGDCYNPYRKGPQRHQDDGTVHPETRDFLQSQGVQPIIPIDTSWLAMGHVDEIVGFVPSPHSTNNRPAKLIMASPSIMHDLLIRARQVEPERGRTHVHRGRYRRQYRLVKKKLTATYANLRIDPEIFDEFTESAAQKERNQFSPTYDEKSVERILGRHINYDIVGFNNAAQTQFLEPIKDRLCCCTSLSSPADVLPLPVWFAKIRNDASIDAGNRWGEVLAESRTPNVVNLQVLNTSQGAHLIVPRPCGPRLPPPEAHRVVEEVLEQNKQGNLDVSLSQDTQPDPQNPQTVQRGFQFWAWPDLQVTTLALFFTHKTSDGTFVGRTERSGIIEYIRKDTPYDELPPALQTEARATWRAIRNANPSVESLLDSDRRFTEWCRLFIPENTVDVLEAYTQSVLEGIGCHVHFVDAWYYHAGSGVAHCGTKVLHRPPTAETLRRDGRSPWWETYPDLADVNTSYDPRDTAHRPSNTQHPPPP